MTQEMNANLSASTTGDTPGAGQPSGAAPQALIPQPPAPDPNAARSTVSFYFTDATRAALDAAWRVLREQASRQGVKVSSVSKSAIVDLAVQWACADLEARGNDSALAELLK